MRAVVEEPGGTAYEAFGPSGLSAQGVRVYGKTGSTEAPENAWFAAFVEDDEGAKLAIAVVIEGGLSGTRHGAPLGREVVQACVEAGYVGKAAPTSPLLAP
jgi:cell division protein FtsI/penicillin-binding protein 2